MTRSRCLRSTLAVALIGIVMGASSCGRSDRRSAEQLRTEIAALEVERDSLRERLDALVLADDRLAGMPDTPVRIGIPTSLTRDLIQRVMTGLADQVTIVLTDMHVNRQGTIRRLVTLGDYNLQLTVNRVSGTIKAGAPVVTFGDDKVSLSMPLAVTAGSGRATVRFVWDGRTVAGAVCGDLDVTQVVTGSVRPRAYPVKASLTLTATATDIVMTPKLPTIRINLGVRPSAASWAAFQKILDDKHGVCGFVLDRIDVLDSVRELINRGFDVRLPTEKLKAVAIPVSIEPSMLVNGTPVALGITVGELSVTQHAIWLGAHVSVAVGNAAVR